MEEERDALARYEAAVLAALGAPEPPVERWGRVYDRVSQALTAQAQELDPGPTALFALDELPTADLDAVWGLIYSARSFAIARRLFAEVPPAEGLFVELGAGWGPFGLAAAELGRPVCLVDVSSARLERARSLFRAVGVAEPELRADDAWSATIGTARSAALPFSLGEMLRNRGPAAGADWLAALSQRLGGGGPLYVVEPGTFFAARQLQTVRDALVGRVPIAAPCTRAPLCPALADPQEWCHFTWHLPLGPVGQAIAQAAKRRWQEVHFSFLVLGVEAESGVDRVLESRSEGRAKARARTCTPAGFATLTALRRHRSAFDALEALGPGSRIRVDRATAVERGDGLRIETVEGLTELPSAFHVKPGL